MPDVLLKNILEELLNNDITITAREITRHHPTLKHASTITRSIERRSLLKEYQDKQKYFRKHINNSKKQSQSKLALQLAEKDKKITELEKQVQILTASHIAMLKAVGEIEGMSAWIKFFEKNKDTQHYLLNLDGIV